AVEERQIAAAVDDHSVHLLAEPGAIYDDLLTAEQDHRAHDVTLERGERVFGAEQRLARGGWVRRGATSRVTSQSPVRDLAVGFVGDLNSQSRLRSGSVRTRRAPASGARCRGGAAAS